MKKIAENSFEIHLQVYDSIHRYYGWHHHLNRQVWKTNQSVIIMWNVPRSSTQTSWTSPTFRCWPSMTTSCSLWQMVPSVISLNCRRYTHTHTHKQTHTHTHIMTTSLLTQLLAVGGHRHTIYTPNIRQLYSSPPWNYSKAMLITIEIPHFVIWPETLLQEIL